APGAREVIQDGKNGRLIKTESHADFISALNWFTQRTEKEHLALRACALTTAETFSLPRTADKALALYGALSGSGFTLNEAGYDTWHSMLGLIKAEWELIKGYAEAAVDAFSTESHDHTIR
ncbi:MAG TPA: glycosyl transferase family 1, partial [Gammaproteobacteria bacterium]|nr:glycosyl transferase family 1 [Gammaproteobacteria bacterium]